MKALKRIKKAALKQLRAYSTTYDDDVKLLENVNEYPFGSNKRNARNILKHEKQVLRFYLEFTERMLKMFNLEYAELKAEIHALYGDQDPDSPTDEALYAREVVLMLVRTETSSWTTMFS